MGSTDSKKRAPRPTLQTASGPEPVRSPRARPEAREVTLEELMEESHSILLGLHSAMRKDGDSYYLLAHDEYAADQLDAVRDQVRGVQRTLDDINKRQVEALDLSPEGLKSDLEDLAKEKPEEVSKLVNEYYGWRPATNKGSLLAYGLLGAVGVGGAVATGVVITRRKDAVIADLENQVADLHEQLDGGDKKVVNF